MLGSLLQDLTSYLWCWLVVILLDVGLHRMEPGAAGGTVVLPLPIRVCSPLDLVMGGYTG
jgi:hypothetical protein